jgi:hypothetical protein
MSLITLDRFAELRVSNIPDFESVANTLLAEFNEQPEHKRKAAFAQSKTGGGVYLYRTENPKMAAYKDIILEIIPSPIDGAFITCLYAPHPVFASPGETVKAREQLIEMIERMYGATPGAIVVPDATRGRNIHLYEFATQQLIDRLKALLRGQLGRLNASRAPSKLH